MEQLLIVEDDIGLNQGLCKALKADARQIISCQDLKTAKEQLLCGSVSLILLDINLPDSNGLELLREVKENMPEVPVILLTANDTDMDIVDGLERGADDYITKPFSLSVLRARVNTQLRKQASSHKNAPICIDLLMYESKATARSEFTQFRQMFLLIGGILCAIIGLVGPLAGKMLGSMFWFFEYRFTVLPVLLTIPVFLLLGRLIPCMMYDNAAKCSVVEQLRDAQ